MAVSELVVNVVAKTASFAKEMNSVATTLGKTGREFKNLGMEVSKLTAPLAAFGAFALKTSISFESAFTGVEKTVDATSTQLKALEQEFKNLSTEVPASFEQISAIGEIGGQLGVEVENLKEFTKTMIQLGDAAPTIELTEAANQMGQFAVVTKMSQEDFDRLASSVVALGNNLATNEQAILNMAERLAGTATVVGMTQAQIIGLSGALSQLGLEAEGGGSAFNTVLLEMYKAAQNGGKELQILNQLVPDFANKFKNDASGALVEFLTALDNVREGGGNVIAIMEALGLKEKRLSDALLRATGNTDALTKAIDLSTQSWTDNTALSEEASKRYATAASKLKILWNEFRLLAVEIGDQLLPVFQRLMEVGGELLDWLRDMSPETKKNITDALLWASALGAVSIALATIVPWIQKLAVGLIFVATKINPVVIGLSALVAGLAFAEAKFDYVTTAIRNATSEMTTFSGILGAVLTSIPGMGGFAVALSAWRDGVKETKVEAKDLNKTIEVGNVGVVASLERATGKTFELKSEIKKTNTEVDKGESFPEIVLPGKEADKAIKKAKELREEFEKIRSEELQDIKFDKLKDNITGAIESLSTNSFESALKNYETAFKQSTIESLMDAYKISFDEASDLANVRWGEIAQDYQDQLTQANEQAFQDSVSFFESIFQNAITGQAFDLKDALEQVAVGFASQMAAVFSGGFSMEGGVKGIGQQLAGLVLDEFKMGAAEYLPGALGEAGSTAAGYSSATSGASMAGLAATFAPLAVAAVAGVYGYTIYDAAKGLLDGSGGNDKAAGINAALGSNLMTAWIPAVANFAGIDLGFGSDGDQMAWDREALRQQLQEVMNVELNWGARDRFEEEWGSAFQAVAGDSMEAFSIAGTAMQQFYELTEGVGPQIGYLLAENLGGSIEEVKYALYGLGIDLSGMEEQFVKMGLQGKKSWLEVETGLQGLAELTQVGINGIGQYITAFDHLIESGGRGAKAILSVKNLAIEAMEDGAKSLADLEARLRESGKYTDEQITTLFQALSQRGITSLEQLAGASDRELGGVVADISAISSEFFAAAADMNKFIETAEDLGRAISEIPESISTEYNIKVNVTGDEIPPGMGTNQTLTAQGIPAMDAGGIVRRPTLALIGERRPEAVIPLEELSSIMRSVGQASDSGSPKSPVVVNNHFNVQGGMPGVENLVKQAVREAGDVFNNIPGRY